MEQQYLTTNEVIKLFSISRQTLYNWTKGGLLKAKRISRKIFYSQEDINNSLKDVNEYKRIRNNDEDYAGTNTMPYHKEKKLKNIIKKFWRIVTAKED